MLPLSLVSAELTSKDDLRALKGFRRSSCIDDRPAEWGGVGCKYIYACNEYRQNPRVCHPDSKAFTLSNTLALFKPYVDSHCPPLPLVYTATSRKHAMTDRKTTQERGASNRDAEATVIAPRSSSAPEGASSTYTASTATPGGQSVVENESSLSRDNRAGKTSGARKTGLSKEERDRLLAEACNKAREAAKSIGSHSIPITSGGSLGYARSSIPSRTDTNESEGSAASSAYDGLHPSEFQ